MEGLYMNYFLKQNFGTLLVYSQYTENCREMSAKWNMAFTDLGKINQKGKVGIRKDNRHKEVWNVIMSITAIIYYTHNHVLSFL